jgi:rubrerythrin
MMIRAPIGPASTGMERINLEAIDVDGAVRESADAVSGDTRLGFLKKAGLTGGAAIGGGALLSALTPAMAGAATSRPPSSFGKGDIGILNYALTLEYLEAAFYNEAAASGAIKDPAVLNFLKIVQADENAHVKFLKAALGSKAAKKPTFDFQGTTKDEAKFRATSQVLENTGVHAYLGQAGNIKTPAYLKAAGSILTIEARHASVIGFLNGQNQKNVTPNGSRDTPYTAKTVLAAVKATGFIVG